jgi:hypothetical protein
MLLVLVSTAILGSEYHGTRDRILVSDGSGSLKTDLYSSHSVLSVNYTSWGTYTIRNESFSYFHFSKKLYDLLKTYIEYETYIPFCVQRICWKLFSLQ